MYLCLCFFQRFLPAKHIHEQTGARWRALLEQKWRERLYQQELRALLRERMRQPYRQFWNLPHVREVMAHCPNIIVCTSATQDNAYIDAVVPHEWKEHVKDLCKAVRREYHNMLHVPEEREEDGLVGSDDGQINSDEEETASTAFRMWGRTAFFPMDQSWTCNDATDRDLQKLEEALSHEQLQVLIFPCAGDILNSIDSADKYSPLGRAFRMLADWKSFLVPGSNKKLAAAIEKKNVERERRRNKVKVTKALRSYRINKDVDERLDSVIAAHQSTQASPWVAALDPNSGRFYYW